MAEEIVYLGHDNTLDLCLKADGAAQDLSAATKITASIDGTLISSTDKAAGVITWDQSGYDTGEIRLDLGEQSLNAGQHRMVIVVYDAGNTNGVVWGKGIDIRVREDVEASEE